MTVTIGQTIAAVDYNTLFNAVSPVYGTGTGNTGYGQSAVTLTTASVGAIISATKYSTLVTALTRCCNHQGTSTASLPTVNTGSLILAADTNGIATVGTLVTTNRFNTNGGASMTTTSAGYTNTRGSSWGAGGSAPADQIIATFTADWGSEDAARFFFNSGGALTLRLSQPGATAQDTAWGGFFTTNLGKINIFQGSTTQTNAATPRGTLLGSTGFYQLTGTPATIYTATFPSGAYSANTMTITAARRNFVGVNAGNGTGITFVVTLTDAHTGTSDVVDSGTVLSVDFLKATVVLTGIVSPTFATVSGF